MKNKFRFLSLSAAGGRAKFTMMLPFDGAQLSLEAAMRGEIMAEIRLAASIVGHQTESLGVGVVSQYGAQPAPIQVNSVDDVLPKESDYYYKDYRAISATLSPCYALDFSKPGVLEAATPLLKGQTVYKDHCFYSVDYWVGVVSESMWDAKGEASSGVPGINVRLKLDVKKDPMLVRGVAMEPPAIHSTSSTVLFEFEFSHPDLAEEGRFWGLLGEEVRGELVRLVVTKIEGFWEQSLVFQGAQEENKQLPSPESTGGQEEAIGEGEEELGAKRKQRMSAGGGSHTTQLQRSETVKISAELRKLLGLPDAQGEDVEDAVLLPAIEGLGRRAAAGDALVETARAECLRVATLAEGGSGDELPAPIATAIKKADATELSALTEMYAKRAEARFTRTCQDCGSTNVGGRSSVEDKGAIEQAGGVKSQKRQRPRNSIF
ncbi:MAG: hypothetical protein ICV60_05760 [Pyrinomonadaceae bacterium]|nr:hypothetical protein [Pyrinomonadaceae bacterium]